MKNFDFKPTDKKTQLAHKILRFNYQLLCDIRKWSAQKDMETVWIAADLFECFGLGFFSLDYENAYEEIIERIQYFQKRTNVDCFAYFEIFELEYDDFLKRFSLDRYFED